MDQLPESSCDAVTITTIDVSRMMDSSRQVTYFVNLTTSEGFTKEISSYSTGHIYNNFGGATDAEALDLALRDAADWGDFFNISVTPYIQKGEEIKPSIVYDNFTCLRNNQEHLDGKS